MDDPFGEQAAKTAHQVYMRSHKAKQWRLNNPERAKEIQSRAMRKMRYGLTQEDYDALPQMCAICEKSTDLVVDHNHGTGKVRGLLCRKHNAGLGMFDDDPLMLLRAVDYLMGTLVSLAVDQVKRSFGVAKSGK